MTEIGFVIQPGESIPDDVTAFADEDGDVGVRVDGGWACFDGQQDRAIAPYYGTKATASEAREWAVGPLTVTAVREPAPVAELVHLRVPTVYGAACDSDLWQDPEESPDLWPQSTSDRDKVTCEACRATFTAAPDDVLDLVRQYGDARCLMGIGRDYAANTGAAAVAFARIAALVPQPVQARDEAGIPLFIHACGHVSPESTPGVDEGEHHRFPPCRTPGPWRPLLVGGDLASEARLDQMQLERDEALSMLNADRADILAQVMGELGVDRPEDVLAMIGELQRAIERACNERDEARAEVERYQRLLKSQASNFAAATAAQSDPLVLSLPTVPEGAVALVGGMRWERVEVPGITQPCWKSELVGPLDLGAMLDAEPDGVRVEMAPPREPRTWPQSVAPDDIADALEVKGHGRFVVAVRRAMPPGGTTYIHADDVDEHGVQRGLTWTLGRLRELGDVTEVFDDEPGGAS